MCSNRALRADHAARFEHDPIAQHAAFPHMAHGSDADPFTDGGGVGDHCSRMDPPVFGSCASGIRSKTLHQFGHGGVRILHANQAGSRLQGCIWFELFRHQHCAGPGGIDVQLVGRVRKEGQVSFTGLFYAGKSGKHSVLHTVTSSVQQFSYFSYGNLHVAKLRRTHTMCSTHTRFKVL